MYYNKRFSNGSVSNTTPMYITIQALSDDLTYLYTWLLGRKRAMKKVRVKIK